jgi:NAD(P)H-dependent FMN reductase
MKILVINGASRPGNVTGRVAKWAAAEAARRDDFDVELLELADYDLPYLSEAGSPLYNPQRQLSPHLQRYLDKLAAADGYIIASPEYNRLMPAVLKNAIDLTDHQMDRKPVALVTHGSTGGALAAESLRQALRPMSVANVAQAVTLIGASEALNEAGELSHAAKANPYGPQFAITALLDNLAWWSATLKAGRAEPIAAV